MRRRPIGVFANARFGYGTAQVVHGGEVKGTWRLTDTGWTWSDFFQGGDRPKVGLREAYRQVAAYKRCIDLRGRALSRLPFNIERIGTDTVLWESEKEPTGDLAQLAGLKVLLRKWGSSLCATGAAYGLKDRPAGKNMQITYANPLSITIEKTAEGPVYKRKVNNQIVTVPEKLIIPIFSPDWAIEQGPGAADAQAGLVNAQVLYELHHFLAAHLRGGLVKASVLTWTGEDFPDDDEEVAELESWWKRFLSASKENPEPRLIDARVKPETVGEGLKDLSRVDIEDAHIASIAMATGTPLSVLKSDAANYATALVDRWAWHEDTVLPDAEVIGNALNEFALEKMGLEIVWKPERSPIFQALQKEVGSPETAPDTPDLPEPGGDGAMQPVDVEGEV